jgi:hypothetical protein
MFIPLSLISPEKTQAIKCSGHQQNISININTHKKTYRNKGEKMNFWSNSFWAANIFLSRLMANDVRVTTANSNSNNKNIILKNKIKRPTSSHKNSFPVFCSSIRIYLIMKYLCKLNSPLWAVFFFVVVVVPPIFVVNLFSHHTTSELVRLGSVDSPVVVSRAMQNYYSILVWSTQGREIQLGSVFDRIKNDKFPAAFFNDAQKKSEIERKITICVYIYSQSMKI